MDHIRLIIAIASGDMSLLYSMLNRGVNLNPDEENDLLICAIQRDQINCLDLLLKYIKGNFDDLLGCAYMVNNYEIGKYLSSLSKWKGNDMVSNFLIQAVERKEKNWVYLFLRFQVSCPEELMETIKTNWGKEEELNLILYEQQVADLEFLVYNIIESQKNDDFDEYENIYAHNVLSMLFDVKKL